MASLGALESRSNVVVLFRTIFPMHFEDLKRDVESIRLRLGFEKKKTCFVNAGIFINDVVQCGTPSFF